MKHLLLIPFAIVLISGLSKAQTAKTIQNGDFEDWDSTAYTDIDSPWVNTNLQDFTTYGKTTVTKVIGKSGSAVHMETYLAGQDTVSGSMFLVAPTTQKPTTLSGYYRSNVVGHDTVWIFVGFEKAGNVLTVKGFPITVSASTFTPFTINIPAFSGMPDTFAIVLSLTNILDSLSISTSSPGSWLEVDQLAFSGNGTTLQVPDGDFESWTTNNLYNPKNWAEAPAFFGNSSTGISRSTNHYSGKYSLKIVAQPFSFFAQITNGKFITTRGNTTITGGSPYSLTADTLTGYYEYLPSGIDTATVYVLCGNSGNIIGGNILSLLAAPSWTYFEIPFILSSAPDTMLIDVTATNNFNGNAGPSTLYLDDLQLKSQPHNSGLDNFIKPSFGITAFPDPAQNQLNIRFGSNAPSEFGLKIYNSEGRLMIDKEFNSGSSTVSLPIDQLSSGLYFYEVSANGSTVRNKFVKSN